MIGLLLFPTVYTILQTTSWSFGKLAHWRKLNEKICENNFCRTQNDRTIVGKKK